MKYNNEIVKSINIGNAPRNISVANTLFNKKVITYVIGAILILGGAGVLGYELKKKKAHEK